MSAGSTRLPAAGIWAALLISPERGHLKMDIQERLFSLRDLKYRDFNSGLIPTVDPDRIIGVRVPELRKLAKELSGTEAAGAFMAELPHRFYEENMLHGILISMRKDADCCLDALDIFLPYVDNWAVCDVITPKAFRNHPPRLMTGIRSWLRSEHAYTVRFGIRMLMVFYLDEEFSPEYPAMVAEVSPEAYYVRMAAAWYFAEALVRQPEAALPYIVNGWLDPWTQKKAVRKACESFRISPEMKTMLRSL